MRRAQRFLMGVAGLMVAVALAISLAGCSGEPTVRTGTKDASFDRIYRTLQNFDACRALAMRGLKNAQDLKCVYLYGRGWGLDMPEAVAEDMLIEGQWLFDYLYALDDSSLSLVSYAAAAQHPQLAEEMAAFEAFLPEAAAKSLAYHEKTSRALKEAIARVNAAATAKGAFTVQEVPAQPPADPMWGAFGGDGFRLGWFAPVAPPAGTKYTRYLKQHGRTSEWLLQQAAAAGLEFVCPWDCNVFDWADVEKQEGKFDWSRVDEITSLCKRNGLGIWLPVRANRTPPPEWLVQRLGDRACLKGQDGKPLEVEPNQGDAAHFGVVDVRKKINLVNMFDPDVQKAFSRYVGALVAHVRESGVTVVAVELGDRAGIAPYAGPDTEARWRAWLKQRRGGADVSQVVMPASRDPLAAKDAAGRKTLLEFVRFLEEEHVAFYRPLAEAARAAAPDVPLCVQSCEMAEFNEAMDGRHNERLVRELHLVPFHFSSGENIWDDLRRCYSSTHFSGCGTHTGSGNSFAQYAFSSYAHDSLVLFTMPTPIVRGFYWGDCYFYPDLRWRWSSLFGWRRFQERAQGMAPEMLSTRPVPQVAVLWSDTSQKHQSFIKDYVGGTYGFRQGPANYNKVGCIGWDRILDSVDLSHDFVTEDQVRAGALARYRMLIMPSAQALSADVVAGIRQFVQNGGIAIATSVPALFDEQDDQVGGGQLADVFGADFDRFLGASVVAETPMASPKWNEALFEYWNGPNVQKAEVNSDGLKTLYCTFKPRDGAQVLERFTNGDPAVVLNSFGKGRAVAIGYPIGRESFLSDIYHEHYGHNWADWPNGSTFQQGLFRWFELLWPRVGFVRRGVVSEELVPRAVGQDAGWPCWQFTRKGGGYRDYVWKRGAAPDSTVQAQYGDSAPRSVELIFREGENNPDQYLLVFNREGGYGHDPGAIDFECTSKDIKIELARTDVRRIYDLTLGCAVPVAAEKARPDNRAVTTLRTMIEPSMGRMLVLATDDTIRRYAGNRRHGGPTDEELVAAVRPLASGRQPPRHVVIARDAVRAFLAERGAKGITISCESPAYEPAAERLAAALKEAFGTDARITRNSPRIQGSHAGLGVWRAEKHEFIEQPDILLGCHNESHNIAAQVISPGFSGHTQPLPFLTSETFPGPGRSIVVLLRPFRKRDAKPEDKTENLFVEEPAPPKLLVGASDVGGLEAAVDALVEIARERP